MRKFIRIVKGSSAFEYLMSYGWVITIILIVGFFVWQSGILNPPPPTGMSGFSRITIIDWKASTEDNLDLIVMNGANIPVVLTDINADIGDIHCERMFSIPKRLSPGETWKVELMCPKPPTGPHTESLPPNLSDKYPPGTTYMAEINIGYGMNIAGTIVTHSDKVNVWGAVENVTTGTSTTTSSTTI